MLFFRIVEFILGFIATAIFEFLIGWSIIFGVSKIKPDWLVAYDSASISTKLLIVTPEWIVIVYFVYYFWRSRRSVSIGILSYLVIDLLIKILE